MAAFNNRHSSRDRSNRMSVASGMSFESLANEKLFDGSELFEVFEKEDSSPPVNVVKAGKQDKRPSAMEFESGEFFPGKELVDVFNHHPDAFRRRSTISRDRRDSMMSFTYDRRGSMMSYATMGDYSMAENPEEIAEEDDEHNSDPKSLQDSNPAEQVKATCPEDKTEGNDNDIVSNINDDNKHNAHEIASNVTEIVANTSGINLNRQESGSSVESEAHNQKNQEKKKDGIEYIEKVGPYDIICGRNNGAHNWVGNRRFRVTIMMNLKRYMEAPNRDEKTQVIKSVIELLLNTEGANARFIKKVGEGEYVRLKEKQIREKVGHAFRDMISLAEQEGKLEAKVFE